LIISLTKLFQKIGLNQTAPIVALILSKYYWLLTFDQDQPLAYSV